MVTGEQILYFVYGIEFHMIVKVLESLFMVENQKSVSQRFVSGFFSILNERLCVQK